MELPSEAYASVFAHRRIRGEDYAKCEGEFEIDHEVWSMWEFEREADEWKGYGSPSTSAGEWEERSGIREGEIKAMKSAIDASLH